MMQSDLSGRPSAQPSVAALVVVDAHRHADADSQVQARLGVLLAAARRTGLTIVHLVERGSEVADGPCAPASGRDERIVETCGASAFFASALGVVLRAAGVTQIVLAGSDVGFALTAAVRDALACGLRVTVPLDCVTALHDLATLLPALAERTDGAHVAAGWERAASGAAASGVALLRTLEQRVAAAHTALVLIDVQNDFCDPAGAGGQRDPAIVAVRRAAGQIPVLLAAARAAGCLIVHVGAEYGRHVRNVGSPYRFPSDATREKAVWSASAADIDESRQFAQGDVEVCLPGSWGANFIDSIVPGSGELRITKHRFSAFIGTPLEALLRRRGVRTIVVAGVTTNCCVESTVRDAAMLDFNVVVAEDCVAVKDLLAELHDASLEQIRTYFGRVEPSTRIIECWTETLQ